MAGIISETSPKEIFDKYFRQFPLPGADETDKLSNIAKGFRRKDEGLFFKSKYDEPTYLTFRIAFDFDCAEDYAIAKVANGSLKYDEIPHPLLNIILNDTHAENVTAGTDDKLAPDRDFLKQSGILETATTINGPYASIVNRDNLSNKEGLDIYSTYNYLKYNLGEDFRALYLLMFKTLLYDLSINYPFAFTSIEGIGGLFKVDPTSGIRVNPENNVITINCNESLDLRITQLQDWYRQVAWDSVYQRWLLPDMMRFFKMRIYISEMRLFHKAERRISADNGDGLDSIHMVSHEINELMPTICLDCSQCEFVMDESMMHMNAFYSDVIQHKDQTQPKIKIRVGHVVQRSYYGLNKMNKYSTMNDIDLSKYRSYEDVSNYGSGTVNNSNSDDSSTKNQISNQLYNYSAPDSITKTLARFGVDMSSDENGAYDTNRSSQISLLTKIKDVLAEDSANSSSVTIVKKVLTEPLGRTTLGVALSTAVDHQEIVPGLGYLTSVIATALLGIPEIAELSAATEHPFVDDMVRQIVGNIPLSQATDINNTLADLYDASQKGLSNEAIEDNDNGYVEPNLQQPDYKSSATEMPFDSTLPDENKGLSNEAVQDLDNGYLDPGLIGTPYVSTANELTFDATLPDANKGLSNEAIDDADQGYSEPNLQQPEYESTANELPFDAKLPDENKGLSNEAIDDADQGYSEPNLQQPEYESTANELPFDAKLPEENKGLSNEAIEDTDKGYSEPNLIGSPYRSTAVEEGAATKIDSQKREIHSEANEDLDKGYSDPGMQHASYRSTATERKVNLVPANREIHSEANEDLDSGYSAPKIQDAEYQSTAVDRNELLTKGNNSHEIHSEANEDLDNGYSAPKMQHATYKSTANSGKISLITKRHSYKSTAVDGE